VATLTKLDFDQLEKTAFPANHEVSLVDLRVFAYAKKAEEEPDANIAEHVATCAHCERRLELLRATDPILNGEEDARMADLLALAASPERQQIVKERAHTAVAAATRGFERTAQAAAAVYGVIVRHARRD
jgi:hypothetical protein